MLAACQPALERRAASGDRRHRGDAETREAELFRTFTQVGDDRVGQLFPWQRVAFLHYHHPMARQNLSGWGNYPRVDCEVRRPGAPGEISRWLGSAGVIARGLGRSYGDQAISERGLVLDLTGLDRYLDFDEETGLLTCEAGVSLRQIIDDFAPRGFFPLVTPGTKFVTVGGCIANDVHGKAHHVDGCFSSCVESFTTLLADGSVVRASRDDHADLFWASFGGLGLLGVVLTATIRLRRVETTFFQQEAIEVGDLDELLAAFDEVDARFPYSVAWIDPLATGDRQGRGVLTVGDHASLDDLPPRKRGKPLRVSPPSPVVVPFELPELALNPLTLRLLNLVIHQVQARGAAIAHYEKFFYPLDAIGEWKRGYGRRGFTQYQFVVPLEDGAARMRPILDRIAGSGLLPFLNVLKKLGPEQGMLSFPREGYTFAIDFPIQPGLAELLGELDEMVIAAEGRVYLGKDAFTTPEALERMYPKLGQWRAIKAKYDPDDVFASHLSRRVGLTG
ncbi:MAG: FAD-linked oxidase [Proteobacteria bacterium]|nr:MAG: FAD-linked oxidase [Pseudomonadota bacterium]